MDRSGTALCLNSIIQSCCRNSRSLRVYGTFGERVRERNFVRVQDVVRPQQRTSGLILNLGNVLAQ